MYTNQNSGKRKYKQRKRIMMRMESESTNCLLWRVVACGVDQKWWTAAEALFIAIAAEGPLFSWCALLLAEKTLLFVCFFLKIRTLCVRRLRSPEKNIT